MRLSRLSLVALVLAFAAYPVAAQTLAFETSFATSDAAGDGNGAALAADGDLAVLGKPSADNTVGAGAVYVFRRDGGTWTQEAKLAPAESPEPGSSRFGDAVAVDGDAVVVGDPGGNDGRGWAYVFRRTGGAWVQEARLSLPADAVGGAFGDGVDVDGDRLAVGAPRVERAGVPDVGAVFVFERDATGAWQLVERLEAVLLSGDAKYGDAVALDGDTMIASQGSSNRVSGYRRDASGDWAINFDVVLRLGQFQNPIPVAVALDGGVLVVGDPNVAGLGVAASGAAYVYVRSPDGVWAGDFLTPVTGDAQGPYGTAVAVRDGVVAVGAPFSQDAAGPGQVTVFARSGGAWTEVATAASPTPDPAERFGSAVALGADRLLVHAEGADTFDGQTYVFGALPVDVADTPQESGLALGISPNPSAGDATVTLALDAPGAARVVVFDALGRRVAVLHDGPLAVGEHAFEIDAGRLAPGLYIVRTVTPTGSASRTLSVVR